MRVTAGFLMTCILALAGAAALAQSAGIPFSTGHDDGSLNVEITADSLGINEQSGSAVFEGDVRISQGDLHLFAPRVTVFYGAGAQDIDRIEASGGIMLSSGDSKLEAQVARYEVGSGTVALEGDVLLVRGPAAISAQAAHLDIRSGTAQLSGRVKTVLSAGN